MADRTSYRGVARDRPVSASARTDGAFRDQLAHAPWRANLLYGERPVHYVITGSSAAAAQTSVEMFVNNVSLDVGELGVPVPSDLILRRVVVSFYADTDPGGAGTVTFSLREPGSPAFVDVATFEIETS